MLQLLLANGVAELIGVNTSDAVVAFLDDSQGNAIVSGISGRRLLRDSDALSTRASRLKNAPAQSTGHGAVIVLSPPMLRGTSEAGNHFSHTFATLHALRRVQVLTTASHTTMTTRTASITATPSRTTLISAPPVVSASHSLTPIATPTTTPTASVVMILVRVALLITGNSTALHASLLPPAASADAVISAFEDADAITSAFSDFAEAYTAALALVNVHQQPTNPSLLALTIGAARSNSPTSSFSGATGAIGSDGASNSTAASSTSIIVGCVIAAMLVVTLVLLCCLFRTKRRRRIMGEGRKRAVLASSRQQNQSDVSASGALNRHGGSVVASPRSAREIWTLSAVRKALLSGGSRNSKPPSSSTTSMSESQKPWIAQRGNGRAKTTVAGETTRRIPMRPMSATNPTGVKSYLEARSRISIVVGDGGEKSNVPATLTHRASERRSRKRSVGSVSNTVGSTTLAAELSSSATLRGSTRRSARRVHDTGMPQSLVEHATEHGVPDRSPSVRDVARRITDSPQASELRSQREASSSSRLRQPGGDSSARGSQRIGGRNSAQYSDRPDVNLNSSPPKEGSGRLSSANRHAAADAAARNAPTARRITELATPANISPRRRLVLPSSAPLVAQLDGADEFSTERDVPRVKPLRTATTFKGVSSASAMSRRRVDLNSAVATGTDGHHSSTVAPLDGAPVASHLITPIPYRSADADDLMARVGSSSAVGSEGVSNADNSRRAKISGGNTVGKAPLTVRRTQRVLPVPYVDK